MIAGTLQSPDGKTPEEAFDTRGLSEAEVERRFREWSRQREAEYQRLLDDARQVMRATRSWWGNQREDRWLEMCATALHDQRTGRHVIEQLGAERLIDPKLMAQLWAFREGLVADTGAETAGELALVDMAVVAYANVLRVQGWIGNWSLHFEREAFGQKELRADFRDRYGRQSETIRGLRVDEYVARVAEDLLPLVERFQRMMQRALAALRDARAAPSARAERGAPAPVVITIATAS